MPFFARDDLDFHYRDLGAGVPFVFQHGLGADLDQPCGLFRPPEGIRLLSFDCRGHGQTRPLGDPEQIGLSSFASDLGALLDALQIQWAVVGGISMGAALALRFALSAPDRVLGLVLSRPAWLDRPTPRNVAVFATMARLIREHGARRGQEVFRQTVEYRQIQQESPESANSLLGQFDNPRAEETVIKLERILRDSPCHDLAELDRLAVPTLVLANRQDPIHPFEFGEALARRIAGAEFGELTPKSVSALRHAADTQMFLADFLTRNFLKSPVTNRFKKGTVPLESRGQSPF
jgi:pimeloyl-ACP methyl ester carboxylesterase